MDAPVPPRIAGNSMKQNTQLLARKTKRRETGEYFKGLFWKHLLQEETFPNSWIPTRLLKCNPTFLLTPIKVATKIKHFFLVFLSELTSFWKFNFARTGVLFLFHWCSFMLAVTFVLPQQTRAWTLQGLEKRDIQKEQVAERWMCSNEASFSNWPLCSLLWVSKNH